MSISNGNLCFRGWRVVLATGAGFLVLVKEAEAELLVESARFLLDCLGAELQGKFCGTIKRVLANLKANPGNLCGVFHKYFPDCRTKPGVRGPNGVFE